MFTNDLRQAERTGKSGTPRPQHLQTLVTNFQATESNETKEKIAANLANFAYDPYNYPFLRDLNVLELFIDCLSDPTTDRLVEFGAAGICNAAAALENARIIAECGGGAALVECLLKGKPGSDVVRYAIGGLYYLLGNQNQEDVLTTEVVAMLRRLADTSGGGGVGNLAKALLDKHLGA